MGQLSSKPSRRIRVLKVVLSTVHQVGRVQGVPTISVRRGNKEFSLSVLGERARSTHYQCREREQGVLTISVGRESKEHLLSVSGERARGTHYQCREREQGVLTISVWGESKEYSLSVSEERARSTYYPRYLPTKFACIHYMLFDQQHADSRLSVDLLRWKHRGIV